MAKLIDVVCEHCQNPFQKPSGEYNRSKRLGRKFYCSLRCYGKMSLDHIPPEKRPKQENFLPYLAWRLDKYSPFRMMFRGARSHTRTHNHGRDICDYREFSITLEDLHEQWESQKGICPVTGWEMIVPRTSYHFIEKVPNRASIDRIDSTKGYTKDNVRFVALIAQYAKHTWADEDVLNFCRAVSVFRAER